MIIRLDKARVTSETHEYDKAVATITDNGDGTASVQVFDRRSGETLASNTGQLVELDRTQWNVGTWIVARQEGCGCSGTSSRSLGG